MNGSSDLVRNRQTDRRKKWHIEVGAPPKNCQNQLSYLSLSHIEQECQESLIQGKINIQQNLNKDLKYW